MFKGREENQWEFSDYAAFGAVSSFLFYSPCQKLLCTNHPFPTGTFPMECQGPRAQRSLRAATVWIVADHSPWKDGIREWPELQSFWLHEQVLSWNSLPSRPLPQGSLGTLILGPFWLVRWLPLSPDWSTRCHRWAEHTPGPAGLCHRRAATDPLCDRPQGCGQPFPTLKSLYRKALAPPPE